MSNSVSLHRIIKASPEKVFRAFTQASAIASWLPPYGFLCIVHEMKVEVGGSFKMSFENFTTGHSHSFGGVYLEVTPNEFLKYSDKFDDPNLPGEMITTVSFAKTMAGTELKVKQDGIPSAGGKTFNPSMGFEISNGDKFIGAVQTLPINKMTIWINKGLDPKEESVAAAALGLLLNGNQ